MSLDIFLFNFLNQYAGKNVCSDSFIIFFAEYLTYFLAGILALFLIKDWKKYKFLIIKILAAAIVSRLFITEIIRFFWERPRPFVSDSVSLILEHEATGSFPSGHAAAFFAISGIVYSYNKKAGALFFVASFLISLARVISGVHWPSDIVAGALVGIFSGWLIAKMAKRI